MQLKTSGSAPGAQVPAAEAALGQEYPLPLRQVQHRVRDSLCCHSSRQLEAQRPITFGGLGKGAVGPACRAAMRVASTELEKSLLHGLMAGPLWTAERVSGYGMRTHSGCPHCGAADEDEVHVLWHRLEWERSRETWSPWLRDVAAALPQLWPLDQWPARLRRARLFPLQLAQGVERALLDEFLYRLCGMYLAVLAARMAAGRRDWAGHGNSLFPDQLPPWPRNPSPGTISFAHLRGMRSATNRAYG